MIKIIKTELIYFTTILVALALLLHPDLITSPMQRLNLMINRGNYLHPFLWSFGFYLVVAVIRLSVAGINKLKSRLKS